MKIFHGKSLCALLAAFLSTISFQSQLSAADHFEVTNLVSDILDFAPNTDPNLVNSWGLTFDKHGNLVVADNGTSLATSYAPDGTILSFVINAPIDPTGLESNPSDKAFLLSDGSDLHPAKYLFATEAGTILAYNKHIDPINAVVVADRSSFNAVYKGLAIAKSDHNYFLYATDFHNGQVDVFDSQFNFLFSFTDSTIPTGFAPFNIAAINGKLYVTFAKQNPPDNHDDQAGAGNGFIDIFDTEGNFIKRLVSQGELNSPWGLALAPKNFGDFGGKLLVGNFGNGIINVYGPSGKFHGQLTDEHGGVIVLPGLWAIKFNDEDSLSAKAQSHDKTPVLYFTSGPNCESDGLVGKIRPVEDSSSSSSSSE